MRKLLGVSILTFNTPHNTTAHSTQHKYQQSKWPNDRYIFMTRNGVDDFSIFNFRNVCDSCQIVVYLCISPATCVAKCWNFHTKWQMDDFQTNSNQLNQHGQTVTVCHHSHKCTNLYWIEWIFNIFGSELFSVYSHAHTHSTQTTNKRWTYEANSKSIT